MNSIASLLPDRNALQPTGDIGREQILQCGSDLLLLTLVSSCRSGCPGQGSHALLLWVPDPLLLTLNLALLLANEF